jgi:hypothetical protein
VVTGGVVVVVVPVDVVEPVEVVDVLVDVLDPDVVLVVVAVELLPVSLAVAGGVLPVVAAAEEPDSSSPPQPASAIAVLPTNAIHTRRPDPKPRPTFLIQSNPRKSNSDAGHGERSP